MVEGTQIDQKDLSVVAAANSKENPDLTLMEAMERNAILQMLKDTQGNKLETAKRLGIGDRKVNAIDGAQSAAARKRRLE